jgi:hypothetical protein
MGSCRGEAGPPRVLLERTQALDRDHAARARRGRGEVRRRGTSATGASRVARGGHAARADRVIAPRARPAPAAVPPPAGLCGEGGFGRRPTGDPPGVPRPHVVGHGVGCRRVGCSIGWGMRRRQVTRRPPDTAPGLRGRPPAPVFALHRRHDAWPMPASGRCQPGPPRLRHHQGPRRWRRPPRGACLAHAPGARAPRHDAKPRLQTPAEGPATIGLTSRHHPAPPRTAPRQTCRTRHGRFDPITAVASTPADAAGQTPSPAHPQPQESLVEGVATIVALPSRRVGGLWTRRRVRRRAIPGDRRGLLRSPWGRERIDRQRLEGDRAQHAVKSGRTQRIQAVPSAVIMA